MNPKANPVTFACLSFMLCLAASGCGVGYPYYTIEGSPESRVVVIHLGDGQTERVPAGSGIGAGITADHEMQLMTEGEATIEKGAARVTLTARGPTIMVHRVEYDGKNVPYHEPIL